MSKQRTPFDNLLYRLLNTRYGQEYALCFWKEPHVGQCWETSCGNKLAFKEGTPRGNKFVYCPYCGQRLAVSSNTETTWS